MTRCLYCARDWEEHDAKQKRFCNTRVNEIAKHRKKIKTLEELEKPQTSTLKVPWNKTSETTKQFELRRIRKLLSTNTEE